MPTTVRFMAWNIQNFGYTASAYTTAKGANSSLLSQFVAQVVANYQVDILFIMEVLQTAAGSLNNLRDALNGLIPAVGPRNWCYDWIKGSFRAPAPPAPNAPPAQSANDLSWKSGGEAGTNRSEGYAVFWRNDPTKFTMVQAPFGMSQGVSTDPTYVPPVAVPNHCLSLSSKGRDFGAGEQGRPKAKRGFTPADQGNWVDALYPDVSKFVANAVFWGEVRRPASCVINLNNGAADQADRLCPIMVYHAPSNRTLANKAVYISGLAQELYVTNALAANGAPAANMIYHGKTIAAGDYNFESGSPSGDNAVNWNYYYGPYWRPFSVESQGGAACQSLSKDDQGEYTTVQLREFQDGLPVGDPIMGDQIKDYLFSPIDNIFGRGLPAATFSRPLLLRDVMTAAWAQGAAHRYTANLENIRDLSIANHWGVDSELGPKGPGNVPIFSFMQDWQDFLKQIKDNGKFTVARSAAEFVNGFVSDHLPVVVEFTW